MSDEQPFSEWEVLATQLFIDLRSTRERLKSAEDALRFYSAKYLYKTNPAREHFTRWENEK